jgi:hypothetical protein
MKLCAYCNVRKSNFYSKNMCRKCRNKQVMEWRHKRGDNKSYLGQPKDNLAGKKFGLLTVLRFDRMRKKQGAYWWCECKCGKVKSVFHNHLKSGSTKSCGCARSPQGKDNLTWKGVGDIHATRLSRIKIVAKRKGYKFNLSLDYLWKLYEKQKELCALSGVKLSFGKTKNSTYVASLDRIDSSKGYTKGNVQWVHKEVNRMKSNLSDEKFVDWCRRVVSTNKRFPVFVGVRAE